MKRDRRAGKTGYRRAPAVERVGFATKHWAIHGGAGRAGRAGRLARSRHGVLGNGFCLALANRIRVFPDQVENLRRPTPSDRKLPIMSIRPAARYARFSRKLEGLLRAPHGFARRSSRPWRRLHGAGRSHITPESKMADEANALPTNPASKTTLLQKSTLNFPVVGLGASAGGLEALQNFFSAMPDDSGMAFAVVTHLAPHLDSHVAEILQRCTGMPVIEVNEPLPLKADHVYVLPPDGDLIFDDGHIQLAKPSRSGGPHVAVDVLFRTLAAVHQEKAFCAVLSGTGADGSIGLRYIKEGGGVVFAQAPADARFDDMPTAAIHTGLVDFILPAADLPGRMIKAWQDAQSIHLPPIAESENDIGRGQGDTPSDADENALRDILSLLLARTGHDFRQYKRATVLRRLSRRLQVNGISSLSDYGDFLHHHEVESQALLQDLLISVTNFFRDADAFAALEKQVIPELLHHRLDGEPLRVWVPGCATGEEAYSVAILLREALKKAGQNAVDLQIFATDIDDRALAVARRGKYLPGISVDVSPTRLTEFFRAEGDGLRVDKTLRESILFASHNVLRDPPFSRLDLICCRNMLIYIGREAQSNVLQMFRYALRPNGFLFLGNAESAEAVSNLFTAADKKYRIYRANPHTPVARLTLPALYPVERPPVVHVLSHGSHEMPSKSMAALHNIAIERMALPSILLDDKQNMLHLGDGAGRYLEPTRGMPTVELLANVMPSLRIELRAALFQQVYAGKPVKTEAVAYDSGGRQGRVRMTVGQVPGDDHSPKLILLTFEEMDAEIQSISLPNDPAERYLITRYEEEVDKLKNYLRSTIEQADISTADLKATNEELQAINEELRSATEELETSKEELQSANEELSTVNAELKSKVEETAQVNDDLQNFIAASDIATLFVDRNLRIKRFTPQIASLFNVIDTDINRPLLDITNRLVYPELGADLRMVFDELMVSERPVRDLDHREYLARIRPYRTTEDKIAGAVLTFVNVTELRAAQNALILPPDRGV
ncbi:hypothetical protein GN316_06965 [Xylophilus sp. Kf1]|nr:hypothetical protein [Xylophilus sp. Kf1]